MNESPANTAAVPPVRALWNGQSPLQQVYDATQAALVPAVGAALTPYGELLRSVSRIYYDRYNNGFGNGPFTDEMAVIEAHQGALEAHMGAAAFADFRRHFGREGLGARVVDHEWRGDEVLERLAEAAIRVAAAAHAAHPEAAFRSQQDLVAALRAGEERAVAYAATLLAAADDQTLSRLLTAAAKTAPAAVRGPRP